VGKLKNSQKGFTAVEGLLIVLILVVIGAVGYMVYHNDHKTKTLNASTSASTQSTKSTVSNSNKPVATTSPAAISASAVTSFVTTFYNQYAACFNSGNLNQTCTTNLVNQDGTSNLYSYYKPSTGSYPADPIMCAQDNPPSVTVSGVTTTSTSASGVVTENFTTPNTVKFTVVSQSGNLKLDTVTCSPPLVASQGSP
jgi:Tfp pilus assembly protein PilV